MFELLGHRGVGLEALAAAFPWLSALAAARLDQLQTEARYDGYLPRQQADIRSFQREEALSLEGMAFDRDRRAFGGAVGPSCVRSQPASLGGGIPDPGHDAGGAGGDHCPRAKREAATHRFHVKHHSASTTFHVKRGIALDMFVALLLRWNRTRQSHCASGTKSKAVGPAHR